MDAEDATSHSPHEDAPAPAGSDDTRGARDPSSAGETRRLLGGSALVFVGNVGARLLQLLLGVVLARGLGAERFGTFCLVLSLNQMLGRFGRTGLPQSVLKYVAQFDALGDKASVRAVIRGGVVVNACLGLALGAGLWLAAPSLAARVYEHPELRGPFQLLAIALPLTIVTGVFLASLQAVHELRAMVLVRCLLVPGGLVAGAWIACRAGESLTAPAAVFPLVGGLGLVAAWLAATLRLRRFRAEESAAIPWRELIAFALPMLVISLATVGGSGIDVLVLGKLMTHKDLGIYGAAVRGAAIIAFPLGAVNTVFAPRISALHAQGDHARLRQVFVRGTALGTYAGMWLFGVVFCGRDLILSMFGSEFVAGGAALVIVCVGQLVNSATGAVTFMLTMTGRPWLALIDNIIFLTLMVVGLVLVAPWWGLTGSAVVVGAALAGVNLARAARVWKLYRMLPYNAGTISVWLWFALAVAFAGLAGWLLPGPAGRMLGFLAFALPMAGPMPAMLKRLRTIIAARS